MTTIAIIEDNECYRRLICNLLRTQFPELDIVEAGDSDEGLAVMEAHRAALVFVDITLPGRSGLQIIPALKRLGSPHVVVLSGYDETEYGEAAFAAGADRYLVKDEASDLLITQLVEDFLTRSPPGGKS